MSSSIQSKNQFSHWKRILMVLLGVQVLLIAGIYAWHQHQQPRQEAKNLLDFSTSDLDRLVIHDANGHATLKKSGTEWLLPDFKNLPADSKKLNELMGKLQGAKLTWPVTKTSSSHERFEVSTNKFQRRVEFYQGDKKQGELLLGSSPGFKKIHIRRDGDDEVYAVELTSFEFSASDKEWFNKELLAAKNPTLINGKDYVLQKQGDTWSFENDTATKVDTAKVAELVNAFANFSVQDMETTKPEGEVTIIRVKSDAGERHYEFTKAGDSYYVKRDDKEWYFKVSQYEFDRVAKVQKADLKAPVEAAASSSSQGTLAK